MIGSADLPAWLEESLIRHHVPGASVAVFNDGEWLTAAAGTTNVTTDVPLTQDTVMHIGSITKVLNATLVMQLVDEGIVDLDACVLRYLPDLKLRERDALERITVRMLLNHTSGIDGITLPDCGHDEETIEKGVARFAELGQLFDPGAEFSYCNAGTVIAGYLAQRLTGRSWYRLIRERIFTPLQMEHAATLPEEALLHRTSVGHHFDPVTGRLSRTSHAFNPLSRAPAGTTLMMSAKDLVAFSRAHLGEGVGANSTRILSARSAEAMRRMSVSNEGKAYTYMNMGLGWMVSDDGLLHHSGGAPGVMSMLYVHPARRWATAILTNGDQGFSLINEFMAPWLRELGTRVKPFGIANVRVPREPVAVDAGKYVGVYEDVYQRYTVYQTDDGLMLTRQLKFVIYDSSSTQVSAPARLIPLGENRFLRELEGRYDNMPDGYRIYVFRNEDSVGRMRHLGNGACLYRRVT